MMAIQCVNLDLEFITGRPTKKSNASNERILTINFWASSLNIKVASGGMKTFKSLFFYTRAYRFNDQQGQSDSNFGQ